MYWSDTVLERQQRYGKKMTKRAVTPSRAVILTIFLFSSASLNPSFATTGVAGAATVPRCTASSDVSARLKSMNGAATQFFFLVALTNGGTATCSLPGVPRAQAVEGTSRTPVGPSAKY